jgi:predicted RNA polymerase sigma factor
LTVEPALEDLLRPLAPQVLGAVVRRYGHFDTAEDAVQEALLAAASQWPAEGIPASPRAWLITVAARRLTDMLRAEQARRRREDTEARMVPPGHWESAAADSAPAERGPSRRSRTVAPSWPDRRPMPIPNGSRRCATCCT